ncbi:MAG: DUF5703 domain-containing protein [Candidatus Spyradocola sp.]
MRISDYDLTWHGQSESSADSMPLGGRDAGCNVWAQDGQLCLYLAKSGAFDETGALLKLGRLRVIPGDRTVLTRNFTQTLCLEEGCIRIAAGGLNATLWVDVDTACLHLDFRADAPLPLHVFFDCWRDRPRTLTGEELGQCRDYATVLDDVCPYSATTTPDTLLPQPDSLLFFHRNPDAPSLRDRLLRQQGLPDTAAIPDPLKHNTFGGCLTGDTLHYIGTQRGIFDGCEQTELCFETAPARQTRLTLSLVAGQYPSVDDFCAEARRLAHAPADRAKTAAWWREYFSRSYIFIDPSHPGSDLWKLGRNAALFRYMLGCNYYGSYPTKFNGGLFTFYEKFTPDYRAWSGNGFTAQNQRLVYWPMLKTGDAEAMRPQLNFYLDRLSAGQARCERYYGHAGACFPEQINLHGLPLGAEYGWNRPQALPDGEDFSPWVRLHTSTALEFALMMVHTARYDAAPLTPCLPFIRAVLDYYFAHYPRDEHGILRIFPSTALETYKGAQPWGDGIQQNGARNPMDAVAGLRGLLEALIDAADDPRWHELLAQCPELPFDGEKFLPAEDFAPKPFNCELPQLYRAFPYSPRGLTAAERSACIAAYRDPALTGEQRYTFGWHQNGIFAARLGLTEEALRILRDKLADAPRRFPAFWGPGHDWTPDHNHGGSALIQLQEMLLQETTTGDVTLLPAWDRSIDVTFRLWLPGRKAVTGALQNGAFSHRID